MNQLGSVGTTYTSEGPARMAGGGRCKGTGEAGQNLVAPGLISFRMDWIFPVVDI